MKKTLDMKRVLPALTPRRLFVAILFISIFVLAVRENLDPDFFWHLRTGQLIWESGATPRADPFSYTIPGRPWIAHEWLSEAIFFGIYCLAGEEVLILLFAALITLAFSLVYRLSPGKPYLAGFVTLLASLTSAVAWGVRPQTFTLLFTAIGLTLLEGYRHGNSKLLWLFPPLVAVWVNLHGGYLLGLALLGIYLLGSFIGRWLGQPRAPIRPLSLAFFSSLLATFLSPHGSAILTYPWVTLTSPTMQAYIQEWLSPDFHQPQFLPFSLLLLGTILAFALSREKAEPIEVLLIIFFGFASLRSARNIPLYAVLAAPSIARHFWSATQGSGWRDRLFSQPTNLSPWLAIGNWLLLLGAIIVGGLRVNAALANNHAAQAKVFPVSAVDWLEKSGIRGRIFNAYQWGGYLIWRLYPEEQVFIDGRADVYGDEFIENYLDIYWLRMASPHLLREYKVGVVLIESRSPLSAQLQNDRSWEKVYSDDLAVIFVKRESN